MRISDWSSDVCSSDLVDGTGFDSADVKFSLDRALAEDSTNAQKGLFTPIASVETPDAATVVVTLKQPTGSFLFNLGWGDAVIVAPESAAENKNHPVGTGPFVFGRWVKGDRIERSEEHTSELQSLMRISYAVFC